MQHDWVESAEAYEFCSRCGLFEWLAGVESVCSGLYGVATEADR